MADETRIDWDLFAARVPAGTRVRWWFMGRENEGMLIELYPFREADESYDPETSAVHDPKTGLRYAEHLEVQPIPGRHGLSLNKNPEELEYLIGSQWLTFAEVMA